MKHSIVKHIKVKINLAETVNSGCEVSVLSYWEQKLIAHVTCEAQMHRPIPSILLIRKIINQVLNRLRIWRYEVNGISFIKLFSLFFYFLYMVDFGDTYEFVELAAGREDFHGGGVYDHDYVIFTVLNMPSHIFHHVNKNSIFSIEPESGTV